MTQTEQERLLSILHAHGQQFLNAFDIPAPKRGVNDSDDGSDSESAEEWTGFGSSTGRSTSQTPSDGECEIDFDDDFVGSSSASRTPDVMVFLDSAPKRPEVDINPSAKELRKSFMSSKVSKVTSSSIHPVSKEKTPDGESDDERTNTQNDALLHRLLHTKLLSGSLNPDLDLDHAQKGRALAGRVLELSGEARLGKGENIFRREQRNKAAKRVREGLVRKQRENEQKALEEAKNLGNYHPTLKRLYDSNPSSMQKKKRARGIGMGVGKFVGGTLKLSRDEIVSVTGSGKRSRSVGRRGTPQRPRNPR